MDMAKTQKHSHCKYIYSVHIRWKSVFLFSRWHDGIARCVLSFSFLHLTKNIEEQKFYQL